MLNFDDGNQLANRYADEYRACRFRVLARCWSPSISIFHIYHQLVDQLECLTHDAAVAGRLEPSRQIDEYRVLVAVRQDDGGGQGDDLELRVGATGRDFYFRNSLGTSNHLCEVQHCVVLCDKP